MKLKRWRVVFEILACGVEYMATHEPEAATTVAGPAHP